MTHHRICTKGCPPTPCLQPPPPSTPVPSPDTFQYSAGKYKQNEFGVCASFIFLGQRLPLRIDSIILIDLLSITAALGEPRSAARRLAQHDVARPAQHHGLGVAEDGRDLEAPRTLDVHEEAVGALDEALELVGSGLLGGGGVEEVDGHLFVLGVLENKRMLSAIGRREARDG